MVYIKCAYHLWIGNSEPWTNVYRTHRLLVDCVWFPTGECNWTQWDVSKRCESSFCNLNCDQGSVSERNSNCLRNIDIVTMSKIAITVPIQTMTDSKPALGERFGRQLVYVALLHYCQYLFCSHIPCILITLHLQFLSTSLSLPLGSRSTQLVL